MNQVKTFEVTIAVIPFENDSDDKELDYFVDGFYDDFIMDLSRFRSLQIISPKSIEKIHNENKPDQAYQILGADFMVKGKLRKLKDKVKIYIQLISSKSSTIVWADRFEENIEQLFEIQDQIIKRVINSIQEQIDRNLLSNSRKKQIKNLEVYDYWLKGYEQLKKGRIESDLKAREFFEKAISLDEFCSRAYTGMSLSYFNEWSCQLWDLWDSSMKNALKYAQLAVALDSNDSVSLTVIGRIFLYQGDYNRGAYYLKKSLDLNPNEANNLAQIAVSYVYLGHIKEALKLFQKAKRLNPLNDEDYYASGSLIYFELGDYKKSIEYGLKANFQNAWVDLPAMISAGYYMTGDIENMKVYWNLFLANFKEKMGRGKHLPPKEALDWIIRISPYQKDSLFIPFWEYIQRNDQEIYTKNPKKRHFNETLPCTFSKGTGLWEMSFKHKTVFLSDKKGYTDIFKLLEQPNEMISASALMGTKIHTERKSLLIDDKAKKAYKTKIRSLQQDIEAYDLRNDYENLNRVRQEYDAIFEHLSQSLNIHGKSKKFQDTSDKARSAVTWRIRNAIKMIDTVHPDLARYFSVTITTGNYCSYTP